MRLLIVVIFNWEGKAAIMWYCVLFLCCALFLYFIRFILVCILLIYVFINLLIFSFDDLFPIFLYFVNVYVVFNLIRC